MTLLTSEVPVAKQVAFQTIEDLGLVEELGELTGLQIYCLSSWPIKRVFWLRLRIIFFFIGRLCRPTHRVLDFGGGNGVLLPNLGRYFERVVSIDRNQSEAQTVCRVAHLQNIELIEADILTHEFTQPFDMIIAADVLEHFRNLREPVDRLKLWVRPNSGVLLTSLPTENYVYSVLRRVFLMTKPADHYHTASEVEDYLRSQGFVRQISVTVPFILPNFPLFLVSVWRFPREGDCVAGRIRH